LFNLIQNENNFFYHDSFLLFKVVPFTCELETLQSKFRDIPLKVEVFDFGYPYSHECPFVYKESLRQVINTAYILVFNLFCDSLNNASNDDSQCS